MLLKEITKKQIQAYEDVRQSGITNMFDVKKVCKYSGLEREVVFKIMEHYMPLIKKFHIKRN